MSLDDFLALMVYALVPFAWFSAGVLWYAARKPPRIGALTERAYIAIVIAVFLSSIAVLVANSEAKSAFLGVEIARIIFRLSVLVLGFVPVAWVLLWATGRLGDR